jgi:glycerol kinase
VILGIDQGTTGATVLVMDRRGRLRGSAYAELPQHFPKPGWVEHDPKEMTTILRGVVRRALRAAGVRPGRLEAVGLTNQRETAVLWDRETGRPVHRAIVWQDRRTAPLCDALRRRGLEPRFARATGLRLDPYFSGTKVRWLLDNVPGLARRARAGEIAFGTVDSWVLHGLTGGAVHATDPTNASRTLLYDIRARRWDPSLCRTLGVPTAVLPEVRPSSGFFGETAKGSGLPAGIPILGVAGDQQASLVGHGCLSEGQAKVTYGTGCFLLLHTGSRFVRSRHGLLTTLAYAGGDEPGYALEGSVFMAGAAVQWLRDGLRAIREAREVEAIARSLPDSGGVHVVPAFAGLGAPYWDAGARGAVLGLTRGSTVAHVVRATVESIALQAAEVALAMEKDSGVRLRSIRVDGGASKNDWLMQLQADLLGVSVVRPRTVASTAQGAAFLAGAARGLWHPREIPSLLGRPERSFEPRMPARERARRLEEWRAAVARVRSAPARRARR